MVSTAGKLPAFPFQSLRSLVADNLQSACERAWRRSSARVMRQLFLKMPNTYSFRISCAFAELDSFSGVHSQTD